MSQLNKRWWSRPLTDADSHIYEPVALVVQKDGVCTVRCNACEGTLTVAYYDDIIFHFKKNHHSIFTMMNLSECFRFANVIAYPRIDMELQPEFKDEFV